MSFNPRKWSFRRWMLTVAIIVFGVLWLRHEVVGQVMLEGDTETIYWNWKSGKVVEISDDKNLAAFESSIRSELDRVARKHDCTRSPVEFSITETVESVTPKRRFLRFKYQEWVRLNFNISHWGYFLNYGDPIARSRNDDLAKAIETVVIAHERSVRRKKAPDDCFVPTPISPAVGHD
jgi:hypothetical protein